MNDSHPKGARSAEGAPLTNGARLARALSADHGIRLAFVDVTGPAQILERRHLSGPAASTVLAEALVAVSLLAINLKNEDEAISIQLSVDGPLGGALVEVWDSGALRGYTRRKLLPEHDGEAANDTRAILGTQGTLTVFHSTPEKILYSGVVNATPPDVRTAMARWYNHSQQTPAAVELFTESGPDGWLSRVTGAVAEKLPDGDTERFVEVLERFYDGSVKRAIAGELDLPRLGEVLGLADLQPLETRPLRFGCRCSRDKVEAAVLTLPREDLLEMIEEGRPHDVTCHFCGEPYAMGREDLERLLAERDSWH